MDWIDDLLDDRCELYQIATIESLMKTSSVASEYNNVELDKLTLLEAEEIISHLYENNIPTDPREQFKKMFAYGN
tara:strand:- start:1520 stop:1744 length:225 start_codon:yes stop_codon:yes gene_type:complete